jgi:hypothetical protein
LFETTKDLVINRAHLLQKSNQALSVAVEQGHKYIRSRYENLDKNSLISLPKNRSMPTVDGHSVCNVIGKMSIELAKLDLMVSGGAFYVDDEQDAEQILEYSNKRVLFLKAYEQGMFLLTHLSTMAPSVDGMDAVPLEPLNYAESMLPAFAQRIVNSGSETLLAMHANHVAVDLGELLDHVRQ